MTRRAFDTTADIYYGPGTTTPGALKATVSCRLVIEDAIFLAGIGAPLRTAYLTHDTAAMDDSYIHAYFGADARIADQVAIPSGAAAGWWILFEEEITFKTQPTYWRSNLIALPLPEPAPPCACPAVSHIIIGCIVPAAVFTRVVIGGGELAAEGRVVYTGLGATGGRVVIGAAIATEPGSTCADALDLDFGEDFSFTTSTTVNQWYRVAIDAGPVNHCTFDSWPGDATNCDIYAGASCGDKTAIGFISNASLYALLSPYSSGYFYLLVAAQASAFPYTFRFNHGT